MWEDFNLEMWRTWLELKSVDADFDPQMIIADIYNYSSLLVHMLIGYVLHDLHLLSINIDMI